MIRFAVLFLAFCFPFLLSSQCTFNGTNGGQPYSITIAVTPVSISIFNNNCSTNGGFNYSVNLDYTITYTGNVPSSLWTFQGNISCANTGQTSFFSLPLNGVNSSGSTMAANAFAGQAFCPAETATPDIFGCNTLTLNIQGPGISVSNGACSLATTAPVTLVDYSIEKEDQGIGIVWQVTEVYNHHYYEVFHSTDSKDWVSVAQLYEDQEHLSYFHEDTEQGVNYYRIQQYDLDGQNVELFRGSVLLEQEHNSDIKLYPNPTSKFLRIECNESELVDATPITIWDSYGNIIMSTSAKNYKSTGAIDVSELAAGLYFLQLGQSIEINKFMVID